MNQRIAVKLQQSQWSPTSS